MKVPAQLLIDTDTDMIVRLQEFADVHTGGDASKFVDMLIRERIDPVGFTIQWPELQYGRTKNEVSVPH